MGYPEAEQLTLISTPWEKRWDPVWMLTCGASAVQRVDREEPVRAAMLSQVPGLGPPSLPTATDGRDTGSKGPEESETPEVPGVDQAAAQTPRGHTGSCFSSAPSESPKLPGVLLGAEHLGEA